MKSVHYLVPIFITLALSTGCKTTQLGVDREYTPTDIRECVIQLNVLWDDSLKQSARLMEEDSFMVVAQKKTGYWIRGNWLRNYTDPLYQYFQSLGIESKDAMTTIILTSYHRHLKGVSVDFPSLVYQYR